MLKLLNLVGCDVAVFGEKDYQQLTLIRRMVTDLFLDVEVIGGKIIREQDGLAMSSRNVYLSQTQRRAAQSCTTRFNISTRLVREGERDVGTLIRAARTRLETQPEAEVEYVEIADPETLESVTRNTNWRCPCICCRSLCQTRLIDNLGPHTRIAFDQSFFEAWTTRSRPARSVKQSCQIRSEDSTND